MSDQAQDSKAANVWLVVDRSRRSVEMTQPQFAIGLYGAREVYTDQTIYETEA
jgi:hypothetical protein